MHRSLVTTVRAAFATLLAALAFTAAAAVDVNRAAEAELQSVKGVGQGLAARIVAAREQGSFKDWSDFVGRVGGMGERKAAKVSQAGLTVGGAAFDATTYVGTKGRKAAKGGRAAKAPKAPKAPKAERAARGTKAAAQGPAFGAYGPLVPPAP